MSVIALNREGLTATDISALTALSYPMVAPEYAARRSELAKKIGLGRKAGRKAKAKRVRK